MLTPLPIPNYGDPTGRSLSGLVFMYCWSLLLKTSLYFFKENYIWNSCWSLLLKSPVEVSCWSLLLKTSACFLKNAQWTLLWKILIEVSYGSLLWKSPVEDFVFLWQKKNIVVLCGSLVLKIPKFIFGKIPANLYLFNLLNYLIFSHFTIFFLFFYFIFFTIFLNFLILFF